MSDQQGDMGDNGAVKRVVATVMAVERKYGHALRGAQSDRLGAIRETIEALVEEKP